MRGGCRGPRQDGPWRQPLQHRQHEARGLAGAGLGAGEQVAALEHGRDRLELDGGGRFIAVFGDGAHERVGQAERCKRHDETFEKMLGRSPVGGGQSQPNEGVLRGVGIDGGRRTGTNAAWTNATTVADRRPHVDQLREERRVERLPQERDARGAARAGLVADDPFDGLHVSVAPELERFLDVDQLLAYVV